MSIGYTQKLTPLKESRYQIINTELASLNLSKDELRVFRKYITTLELGNDSYYISNEKVILLERKTILLNSEIDNYKKQLEISKLAIDTNIEIQELKENEYNNIIKKSRRLGRKQGIIGGATLMLVVCLLAK